MMKHSAGILVYKIEEEPKVYLTHFGGPYWEGKDLGAWSIPKGEVGEGEPIFETALREFEEETGTKILNPEEMCFLRSVKQSNRKLVTIFTVRQEIDPTTFRSNLFPLEWPPKSGQIQEFPEMDCAAWFTIPEAKQKILKGQQKFLEALEIKLKNS